MGFLVLLTVLPIIIVLILLVGKGVPTQWCAIICWALTAIFAFLFFNTSVNVIFRASVSGVLSSFPISLMVLFSILQVTFMESTGALKRISVFIKTLAPSNKPSQVMLINIGTGTALVSVGSTPVSVLPPIMLALGYSPFVSIALPAVGFDALCTYSMLGAPLVTYSDFTGVPLVEAAQIFSRFLPVISTCICFAMLWLLGGFKLMHQGAIPGLLAGLTAGFAAVAVAWVPFLQGGVVLTGVIAGILVILVQLIYLKVTGKPILDRSVLSEADLEIEKSMSLLKAVSPWLILIVALVFVNFCTPIQQYLFKNLEMAVSVIPGQFVKLRMLWNAYFWVLLSTIVSFAVLKPSSQQLSTTIRKWVKRAPKPVISTAVFFAVGLLMNNTGLVDVDGVYKVIEPKNNMISVLAISTSQLVGSMYPIITAPLGLFAGFITGSEASALAMFAKYNIITADILKLNPLIVTAATGIGAGLASVCTPAKLQNAAATIDAIGEENKVIRKTFKISVILIVITAIMCFIMA